MIEQQSIVKIEPTPPPPKRSTGQKAKFTNADLPTGTLDGGVWRRIFLPTYLQYLSSQEIEDAWAMDDDEAASIMQKIWDYTYGAKILNEITVAGSVFFIVSIQVILLLRLCLQYLVQADHRVSEWRSGFGSTALAILQAFFTDNKIDSDAACREAVESALDNWTFIYREVSEKDGEVSHNLPLFPC